MNYFAASLLLLLGYQLAWAAPKNVFRTDGTTCDCGKVLTPARVVGGTDATKGEIPWMVSLASSSNKAHYCGASLIDEYWVLTAAHCLAGETASSTLAVLGEHDISTTSDQVANMEIEEFYIHPDYNSETSDNDVALLLLKDPVECNTRVNTVCLAYNDATVAGITWSNQDVQVSGWGYTDAENNGPNSNILQKATVKMITNSDCSTRFSSQGYNVNIVDSMICASSPGKDTCSNDSGGPMTYKQGEKAYQTGIVSFGGNKCADGNVAGVYAEVKHFETWMKETMGYDY